jgi:hypothetical protein
MIAHVSARDISYHAVRDIVEGVVSLHSHNPKFWMGCAQTELPRLLYSDCIWSLALKIEQSVHFQPRRTTSVAEAGQRPRHGNTSCATAAGGGKGDGLESRQMLTRADL